MKVMQKEELKPAWYAIHTKYKCEKYVVNSLIHKSINAYTPVLSKTKKDVL